MPANTWNLHIYSTKIIVLVLFYICIDIIMQQKCYLVPWNIPFTKKVLKTLINQVTCVICSIAHHCWKVNKSDLNFHLLKQTNFEILCFTLFFQAFIYNFWKCWNFSNLWKNCLYLKKNIFWSKKVLYEMVISIYLHITTSPTFTNIQPHIR